ncbi:ribonuclease E/G [Eubacterium sp.]|uniref:ribonuclease E/G n=1 Tax=Eubacterium sp. TaxID=142586 RepID=UPI00351FE057
MDNRLIISDFYNNILLGFYFINDELYRIQNFSDNSLIGNIYCGYVKDVVKNIDAAFVEFGDNLKGFLSLKNIEKKPKSGSKILVQVTGDKIKTKDYALTLKLNLSSDNLVMVVGGSGISISRKITDNDTRNRLKSSLSSLDTGEYGFILRTSGADCSMEDILAQADLLKKQYEDILRKFNFSTPKALLFENNKIVNACNEFINKYSGEIKTDNENVYKFLKNNRISATYFTDTSISLCNKYALGNHLKNALSKKVWLKSGAYLVIEVTEALTVIDVNTGKAEFHSNKEKTFEKINLEAALEVSKQLRIRNISGIIIVDFINMSKKESYQNLEDILKSYVDCDYVKCNIWGMTHLGLMEISRQKKEKPLNEIVGDK